MTAESLSRYFFCFSIPDFFNHAYISFYWVRNARVCMTLLCALVLLVWIVEMLEKFVYMKLIVSSSDLFCRFWFTELVGYWITSWLVIKLIWIAVVFRIEINTEESNLDMFMFYCLYWYSVYVKSDMKKIVRFVLFSKMSVHMSLILGSKWVTEM